MGLCHGNGDLARDGCCYVAGQVCPLRLLIEDDGHIYEGPGLVDLGLVQDYVESLTNNKRAQENILAALTGVRYVCRAAAEVLQADTKLLNDRPGFEAAWNSHPEYVAQVRPFWASIEEAQGLPEGTYQCSSWTGGGQCCFSETETENATKASGIPESVRSLRAAGGT